MYMPRNMVTDCSKSIIQLIVKSQKENIVKQCIKYRIVFIYENRHGRFQVHNLHSYVDDNAGIIIHCQSITFGTGNYYKRRGAAKYSKFVDPDQLFITSRLI